MAWFLGQSFLVILAAFLLGVLVGWLLWGRRRPATAAPGATAESPVAEAPASMDEATAVEAEPAEVLAVEEAPVEEAAVEEAPVEEAPVEPSPVEAAPVEEAPVEEAPVEAAPVGAPAAAAVDDDLERVEGIGPRMAGALRAAGIRTFADLAGCDTARLRAAIEAAGLSFAPSLVTWSRQARLLADGDEAGFAALTRALVAGREVTGREAGRA